MNLELSALLICVNLRNLRIALSLEPKAFIIEYGIFYLAAARQKSKFHGCLFPPFYILDR